MTPAQVITAMQAINAAVTGITSAPTTFPAALDTANLPCMLTFPGEAEHQPGRVGATRTTREYRSILYGSPVGQGLGLNEGVQEVITLIPLIVTAYKANRTLSSGGATGRVGVPIQDSGHVISNFAGVDYHSCIFRVRVEESQ